MTISFGAVGTYVSSSSDPITVAAPSAQTANSRTFLVVQTKTLYGSGSANPADPDGWTRLARMDGGSWPFTPASGEDTGIVQMTVWYKDGASTGDATVTFNVPGTVGFIGGRMVRYEKSTADAIWSAKASYGVDAAYGANFSTGSSGYVNFAAKANDFIIGFTGLSSDAGTVSASLITAPGLTVSATTNRAVGTSTQGDDGALSISDCSVTSGTQTSPAVYTHTNASSSQGSVVFIRLTESTTLAATITTDVDFYSNPYYQITVSGLTDFTHFEITRTDSLNEYPEENVRGAALQAVSTSGLSVVDYEFHFTSPYKGDRNILYNIKVYNGDVLQGTKVIDAGSPIAERLSSGEFDLLDSKQLPVTYISDTAGGQIAVIVEDFSEYSNVGTILGQKRVLGRRNPVVRSDVLEGMTGSFILLVHKFGASDNQYAPVSAGSGTVWSPQQLIDFFEAGSTYYLKHLWGRATGIPDFYFKVSGVTMKRHNRIAYQLGDDDTEYHAVMQVTVDFIEQDRPSTDTAAPLFTWADVAAANDSWASVASGVLRPNQTWLDVLIDGA